MLAGAGGTVLLDVSSAPPDGFRPGMPCGMSAGAQIALASDAAGTVYALWNVGREYGAPNAFMFHRSTTSRSKLVRQGGYLLRERSCGTLCSRDAAGAAGDVRIAWMDTPPLFLMDCCATQFEQRRCEPGRKSPYSRAPRPGMTIFSPQASAFLSATTSPSPIDNLGISHVAWGEGTITSLRARSAYTHGR